MPATVIDLDAPDLPERLAGLASAAAPPVRPDPVYRYNRVRMQHELVAADGKVVASLAGDLLQRDADGAVVLGFKDLVGAFGPRWAMLLAQGILGVPPEVVL